MSLLRSTSRKRMSTTRSCSIRTRLCWPHRRRPCHNLPLALHRNSNRKFRETRVSLRHTRRCCQMKDRCRTNATKARSLVAKYLLAHPIRKMMKIACLSSRPRSTSQFSTCLVVSRAIREMRSKSWNLWCITYRSARIVQFQSIIIQTFTVMFQTETSSLTHHSRSTKAIVVAISLSGFTFLRGLTVK